MGCTVDGETEGAGGRTGQDPRTGTETDARAAPLAQALLDAARRGVPAERAVRQRVREDHGAALLDAVTRQLRTGLTEALTTAWHRGWQPADVLHTARRSVPEGAVEALCRGVRDELSRYARSTVDPCWWEQVAALEEEPVGGRRRRRPHARPGGGPPDRSRECVDVLAATAFVERLPALQVLGPLPGAAGLGSTPAAADVDDRLLTKVRRLLAQAEGTPYEAEAETFTAAAQSLMARHRIDRAMLEAVDGQEGAARGPGAVRLPVDRPYEQPKMLLLSVVASANRCRALWDDKLGLATVVGHAPDRRAVELLFTSLLVQATTALRRHGEQDDPASRTRSFRSSFLRGFAARIGQRLEEASQAAEEQARARLDPAASAGTAAAVAADGADRVGLVLRRRDEEVEELLRRLFPHTVRTRSRAVIDPAGWVQGRAAADRASLGVGGQLADGPA